MAVGADKVIAFDPPGAIGLPVDDAIVLLRFDEAAAATRPKDAAGALADLDVAFGTAMPAITAGAVGNARAFDPTTTTGLLASDLASGTSLLTRDLTVQAIMAWSVAGQNAYGSAGTIVARGLNSSSAERCPFGLELVVVDAPSFTGALRWYWHTVAGTLKVQTGANFTLPSGFTMFTATRRWVSPTEVVLRYYIGDLLLGEVTSADGDIGGGTTGRFQIGVRVDSGTPGHLLAGRIDELLVIDREVTIEEIEATWLRITLYQPLGYQLFKEMHDPGFPLPTDPGSDAQLETRQIGMALGYAEAQAENLRANFLPGRAYGTVLEDWETALHVTPQPASSIDQRRARTVARLRQRRGVSIPGLKDALVDLIDTDVDNLEFLAFDNTIREPFTTIEPERWDASSYADWSAAAGTARASPAAGPYLFTGTVRNWLMLRTAVGGEGKQAHLLSKMVMTTPQSNLECGVYFENAATNDYLLLGLRDDAGSFKIVTESFIKNASQGVVIQATLGGNPAGLWLHLYQTDVDGTWKAAWSITSGTAGFTTSSDITHPPAAFWAGIYVRSTAATAGAAQVDADDLILRTPFGTRPLNAYVFEDAIGLGSDPDEVGANSIIQAIKHAFTEGSFITSKSLLCDDPTCGCDITPMGAL